MNAWPEGEGFKAMATMLCIWRAVSSVTEYHQSGQSTRWPVHTVVGPHGGQSTRWPVHTVVGPHGGQSTRWPVHTVGSPRGGQSTP